MNEGSSGITDRFFGDGVDAPFEWFSFTDAVPGGLGDFTAMNPDNPAHFESAQARSDLDAYFAQHRALGDTFVLRGINVIGWDPSAGVVSLAPILFEYHRPDPTTGVDGVHLGSGKAGYHCASASFRVMSLSSTAQAQWQQLYQVHLAAAEAP
jgi:hypothetical protein